MTLSEPMRARWIALCNRISCDVNAIALLNKLEAYYLQPIRAYHSLAHIAACLAIFDQHRGLASNPDAVELALWLHDCIYDPKAKDNEAKSAAIAREVLGPANPGLGDTVAKLIMATLHTGEPPSGDAALIADIDLSILGAPPDDYSAYAAAIRTEYSFVPEDAYRTGRSAVLRSFLARPNLFHAAEFIRKFEIAARANIAAELRSLT